MGERYLNADTQSPERTEGIAGMEFVGCGALAMGPIYQDATYKYFGEAVPGTALSAAGWRVSRMTIADKQVMWADGDNNFDNVFTNLSAVAALNYS